MPAPAVIPALIVYSKIVVVKTLVFYLWHTWTKADSFPL